jgi:ADP-glucose pyrophosphorylase
MRSRAETAQTPIIMLTARTSEADRVADVLTLILGGGRGTRLFPLTHMRSKPAVPIGAKYRLIDIPISNCLHADLKRIFVLTQFNSASLNRHIAQTYRLDLFSNGFVEILAAEQTPRAPTGSRARPTPSGRRRGTSRATTPTTT